MKSHTPGIGLYRDGYISHGGDFWGREPASFVKLFSDRYSFSGRRVLDLGAGTGRHSFFAMKNGAKSCTAIETDSAAVSCFSQSLVNLEESGEIREGQIVIIKGDVESWLEPTLQFESFDVIIMYGLAHVFEQFSTVEKILSKISERTKGFLIFQSILDTYPAPESQPELIGKGWSAEQLMETFRKLKIEILAVDDTDIVHSHTNDDPTHRHGSLRVIGSMSGV